MEKREVMLQRIYDLINELISIAKEDVQPVTASDIWACVFDSVKVMEDFFDGYEEN